MFILMILITIASIVLALSSRTIFHKFILNSNFYFWYKSIDKKNCLTYLICSFFSLICLILYFSMRWIPAVINIANNGLFDSTISEYRSANLSLMFMLDLCSFLGFLMPLLVIVDYKKQILLKPLAMLSILGGMATILFSTPDLYQYWNANIFFAGSKYAGGNNGDEPLMFLMHLWMVVIGCTVVARTDKYRMKHILIIIGFIMLYCAYILMISKLLDIKTHVTALEIGDYYLLDKSYYDHQWAVTKEPHPPYQIFVEIFSTNKTWAGPVISWSVFAMFVILMITTKNISYNIINKKSISNKEHTPFII